MKEFRQEYLNKFAPIDEEYEAYLGVWLVYHRTAERVDGHLPYNAGGGRVGQMAVRERFGQPIYSFCPSKIKNPEGYKKFHAAKLEACRVAERENPRTFRWNR